MEKTIRVLAVLLGIQVVLALGLSFTGSNLAATASDAPLISLEADKVDSLTIEAPNEPRLVLAKVDGAWRLPEQGGFPAEEKKVTQMVKRLADLKRGQPMATTEGAHRRFQVSDDAFERRIVLASGDKVVATLYLGSSANPNQIYARVGKDDGVYAVGIATYEVPTKVLEWEDKAILQVPKDEIAAIEVAGLRLERIAKSAAVPAPADSADTAAAKTPPAAEWRASGLAGNQQLDPEAAENLAGLLAELQIGKVLGREADAGYGLDKPVLTLSLSRKGGQQVNYRLGKSETEEYTLQVSTRPEYFRLHGYVARPLINAATRDTLLAGR